MNRTPFRNSTVSYNANDSPSITMEKGTYRLRAPYANKSPAKALYQTTVKRYSPSNRRSSRLALLLVILAFASISSFGMAYYLYSTRWDARRLGRQRKTDQHTQGVILDAQGDDLLPTSYEPDEMFLSYLPHSGFHNQRIAFENALVLARLLNRTLLVPPIYLGGKRLRYVPFDALYRELALSDKAGFHHCTQCHPDIALPLECMSYFSYTRISWDWLMDLKRIKAGQRMHQRWNLTEAWIYDYLNLSKADVLFIKDDFPYHYRFLDTLTDVSPAQHKFLESIYIPDLHEATERLIHVGTLFGSSRLRLKNPANNVIRQVIRDSMSFANPTLLSARDMIVNILGPSYLGVHLRLGDGEFKKNAEINANLLWWHLVHKILGYTHDEATSLACTFIGKRLEISPVLFSLHEDQQASLNASGMHRWPAHGRYLSYGRRCRGQLHNAFHLLPLNTPIFISTDVSNSPLLSAFHKTFPCIFYLSDFPDALNLLDGLHNAMDDVALRPFLLPFLDALVLGHSQKILGTENSTFSHFAIDVLWRKSHNMVIGRRG